MIIHVMLFLDIKKKNAQKQVLLKKIKEAIKETGLTQQEFARKAGIGETMISRWAKNDSRISLSSLKKIAKAINKPLAYFLDSSSNSTEVNGDIKNSGNMISGEINGEVNQVLNDSPKLKILEKDMEILKLQMELLKKDNKK